MRPMGIPMKRLIAALFALSVAACASPYPAIPFDSEAANIDTISLIEDVGEANVTAYEVASAGSNFGLIGALVDAGVQASRQNAVEEALAEAGFNAQEYFRTQLIVALEGQGYTVEIVEVSGRDNVKLLEVYPDDDGDVQAYLDASLQSWGVLSSGVGTPFRPHAAVEAQLYRPGDGSILMRDRIEVSSMFPREGQIQLSANPRDNFVNRDALLADPERLAGAISAAIDQTVDSLARQLAP